MKLLSIVIPTKNRYKTLIPILKDIIKIESNEFEVVIQDNSSQNEEILIFINEVRDSRIKYFHSITSLSQTENSDLAVSNSNGEFVCFIGDDDIVMPFIVDVVNWMKINSIDVLKSYKPDYYWPGLPPNSTSNVKSGVLTYVNIKYGFKFIDSKSALRKTLVLGGTRIDMLPSLYHGIVSKVVLEKVYTKVQSYFPGPSPDMASAVAISLVIDKFVYLDVPIVVSGKSAASIGGLGVLHLHFNQIKDVSHLPSDTEDKWNKRIPKIWTGQTIWAQSIHTALTEMNMMHMLKDFNYTYLLSSLYLFNYKDRSAIFLDRNHYFNFYFYLFLIQQFFYRFYFFLRNRLFITDIKRVENLSNTSLATSYLNRVIDSTRLPWVSINP